jgi:hypothetical protein
LPLEDALEFLQECDQAGPFHSQGRLKMLEF